MNNTLQMKVQIPCSYILKPFRILINKAAPQIVISKAQYEGPSKKIIDPISTNQMLIKRNKFPNNLLFLIIDIEPKGKPLTQEATYMVHSGTSPGELID